MQFRCPRCGSKSVVPVAYGMPTSVLHHQKVYLAGCCFPQNPPKYYCEDCGKNVGYAPVLLSEHGQENYVDIVTSVRFSDGGYSCGYTELMVKKQGDGASLDVRPCLGIDVGDGLHRKMTETEWAALVHTLYEQLYLHEWNKRFYNRDILDGKQWELEIGLTGRRKRTYYGSNAFPPLWPQLLSLFRPYFGEAGIILFNSDFDRIDGEVQT